MNELYELLLQRGWTVSKRDFSTYWLGKSPSYFATTGGASEGAMLAVMRKLFEEGRWLTALRVLHMIVVGRRLHDDEVAA
jgi:hypothetical protein